MSSLWTENPTLSGTSPTNTVLTASSSSQPRATDESAKKAKKRQSRRARAVDHDNEPGNPDSIISPKEVSGRRRRKSQKVSRACDFCKAKKLKCRGTLPCDVCVKKGLECVYKAEYRRGRPPTPPQAETEAEAALATPTQSATNDDHHILEARVRVPRGSSELDSSSRAVDDGQLQQQLPSRASPELETAEIEGQFFDPTSNLTFLHRAWKRFSLHKRRQRAVPGVSLTGSEGLQPLMSAGDKPFMAQPGEPLLMPDRQTGASLLEYYFDKCVVTYRCLHRGYCCVWMDALFSNVERGLPFQHAIGHAKAALIITVMAIATLRQEKISGNFAADDGGGTSLLRSDQYFCAAAGLTAEETGLPQLESVQARILQVLYLLQTGRMNQAWYVFGSTVPIVSAIGLHRKSRNGPAAAAAARIGSPPPDYVVSQCRKRTFWVVYTIDKYLAVVFGRPRLYHDDDIDQEYPDRVNDEDMTPQGPAGTEPTMDCHVDSLIFHAKIARIIDNISRQVYSLKRLSKSDRLASAHNFGRKLHEWRDALPPHLGGGSIRLASHIPSFRRQALALKLAYSHAIMHANRPFLLGGGGEQQLEHAAALEESAEACVAAARMALQTVDAIVGDGSLFHAFWWTPYVTFCALAVIYVRDIQQQQQQQTNGGSGTKLSDDPALFDLAERCQSHLARTTAADSPSQRYSIILEELRQEARQNHHGGGVPVVGDDDDDGQQMAEEMEDQRESSNNMALDLGHVFRSQQGYGNNAGMANLFGEWQATDWLDLDSSAFSVYPDFEAPPVLWMPDMGG